MQLDISGFNIAALPDTGARQEQQLLARPTEAAFLQHITMNAEQLLKWSPS
mgnify:CR=1 FL=1